MCLQLKSRFLIGKKCNWSLACCLQLDCLIFSSSKVKLQPCVLVQRSPSSFGQFSKKAVIVWFNFDLGCKCFNVGHTSDYPLRHAHLRPVCSACVPSFASSTLAWYITFFDQTLSIDHHLYIHWLWLHLKRYIHAHTQGRNTKPTPPVGRGSLWETHDLTD